MSEGGELPESGAWRWFRRAAATLTARKCWPVGGDVDQKAISRSRDRARRLRASRRLLWVAPAALGGLVLGLQQAGLWNPPKWLAWIAVVSGTVLLLAEGLTGVFRPSDHQGDAYGAGDRLKFMTTCAVEIQQQIGISVACLGVSLWVVHTPRSGPTDLIRRLRRQDVLPDRYLWRVERWRASDPPAIGDAWPFGRGVIGICAKSNDRQFRDYRPIQKDYPLGRSMSNAEWKRLCKSSRDDGFTQVEFVRMVNRYEQVLAYPVTDHDGRLVGCVSVDVTPDEHSAVHPVIDNPSVIAAVKTLADSMRKTAEALAVRP